MRSPTLIIPRCIGAGAPGLKNLLPFDTLPWMGSIRGT